MIKRIRRLEVCLTAVASLCATNVALASSHAEAPGTASDPETDNTDVWAWRDGNNLIVLANYNGLGPAYAAPNWKKFADDAIYEVHVARGPSSLDDVLTYRIKFDTAPYPRVNVADLNKPVGGGKEFFSQISGGGAFAQTYTVTKFAAGKPPRVLVNNARVAPPNVGPRTNAIAYKIPAGKTYEQFFVDDPATSLVSSLGNGEGRVFAGPRDDPFFVDLGAVFDLAGLRTVIGGTPRDSVQYTNVMQIALEIPLDVANAGPIQNDGQPSDAQTIGVWASASRPLVRVLRSDGSADSFGPWRQVSRLGLPLINEAVIGLQDKDRYNRKRPKDDLSLFAPYFLNPVVVRDAEFAGFYDATNGPLRGCLGPGGVAELKSNRTDIIDVINLKNIPSPGAHNIASVGDVLRVDLGIDGGSFPNGRRLEEGQPKEPDVVDIELGLLLCKLKQTVPDGVSQSEVANKTTFPYQATPWESFRSGVHAAPFD